MSDEHRPNQLQRVEHSEYVVTKSIGRVIVAVGERVARGAVAAARDAVDVVFTCELRCERIEDVGVVAESSQEHQRWPRAAPIQDLELDVAIHPNELRSVRWW